VGADALHSATRARRSADRFGLRLGRLKPLQSSAVAQATSESIYPVEKMIEEFGEPRRLAAAYRCFPAGVTAVESFATRRT
jgi:hypothetical protein